MYKFKNTHAWRLSEKCRTPMTVSGQDDPGGGKTMEVFNHGSYSNEAVA